MSDPESPERRQIVIQDTDDSGDGDDDYCNTDPKESDDSEADPESVHSDSGLEESTHKRKGKGKRRGNSGNTSKKKKKKVSSCPFSLS